jgi:alpha-glucoside transport system substrate-binding protein
MQGTRALNEVLAADVQNGTSPDIAILPTLGELHQYQQNGTLRRLDDAIGPQQKEYSKKWLKIQKLGTENLYGVVVKADLKSIIWFNSHILHPAVQTWDQLVTVDATMPKKDGTTWCMGMGSTPVSGWPGTDWVEDILLHQFGTETYRQWASGTLSWKSPEVHRAWEDWGNIINYRGIEINAADRLGRRGTSDVHESPGMLLVSPTLVYDRQLSRKRQRTQTRQGFRLFPFSNFGSPAATGGAFEVSASIAGMFNDTPQARRLIKYLATEEAQKIWPRIGGAFSANRNVAPDVYQDDASKRIAHNLTTGTLCYDASDLMPAAMRNAFYRAILEYLGDPTQLSRLLKELEIVRQRITPEEWLNIPCGQ